MSSPGVNAAKSAAEADITSADTAASNASSDAPAVRRCASDRRQVAARR